MKKCLGYVYLNKLFCFAKTFTKNTLTQFCFAKTFTKLLEKVLLIGNGQMEISMANTTKFQVNPNRQIPTQMSAFGN